MVGAIGKLAHSYVRPILSASNKKNKKKIKQNLVSTDKQEKIVLVSQVFWARAIGMMFVPCHRLSLAFSDPKENLGVEAAIV